jgi:hypothetical protein
MSSPHPSRIKFALALSVGVATLVLTYTSLQAQTAPNLGTAAQFAVLGNSGVTGSSGSGTVVSGDVGSHPTGSITNFPPSTVTAGFTLHTTANSTVEQAQIDARAAYNSLAAQGGTPIAGDDLNITLTSGVYSLGAANLPASTNLTLNGSGIFIFNVASTLVMNASSAVIGSANPCNVYWRVGTSATLNGTAFWGTVIADASITVGSGSVTGRLLSGTGATGATTLTVGGNTVGGCNQARTAPTISKAFSPTSIIAGGTSRLNIQLTNANSGAISLTSAFVDTLPSGVVVAATPGLSTTCGGPVSAPAGGSTITLNSAATVPSGFCTITVTVTSPTVGTYENIIPSGALQTAVGSNLAPAQSTLLVTAAPPPVCPVITLSPSPVPNGTVGAVYSQQMTGSGGTAPYSFGVTIGTLPAGMTLSVAGLLNGTPTTVGSSPVTIRGTDANACFAEAASTIVIAAAPTPPSGCPALTLSPATINNGIVGVPLSQTFIASGGTAPYTYGVISGALPTGVIKTAVGGLGLISGTPTVAGSYSFSIRATDSLGCLAERAYVVVVTTAVPTMPEIFLMLLAVLLTTIGYMHLRRV